MKPHRFDFKLPMYPASEECSIKMDGKELSGVTSLLLRAGVEGYTNVVMAFEAPTLASFVAYPTFLSTGFGNDEDMAHKASRLFWDEVQARLPCSVTNGIREVTISETGDYFELALFINALMERMAELRLDQEPNPDPADPA